MKTKKAAEFYRMLGGRLARLRKDSDGSFTQLDVAKHAGCSDSQIKRYEANGRETDDSEIVPIPAYVLMTYAILTGTSLDEICGDYLRENLSTFRRIQRQNLEDFRHTMALKERKLIEYVRKNEAKYPNFLTGLMGVSVDDLSFLNRVRSLNMDVVKALVLLAHAIPERKEGNPVHHIPRRYDHPDRYVWTPEVVRMHQEHYALEEPDEAEGLLDDESDDLDE